MSQSDQDVKQPAGAKPMFIDPHHRANYPDLFRGTRKPLAPGLECMTSRIAENFHSELPMVSRRPVEALGVTSLVPLEDHFGQKAAVVRRWPEEVSCSLLRLPASWSTDQAPDIVVDPVRSKLDG